MSIERPAHYTAHELLALEEAIRPHRSLGDADDAATITRIYAQLATAQEDSRLLDWLCEYITAKGSNGVQELVWTVYDEEGKSLMHRDKIGEDEVGDIRFDRPAIRAAMQAKPTPL